MSTSDLLGFWAHHPSDPLPGAADGPLAGLRFTAKDLFGVPGWPLRAGTRAPLPPVDESPLVPALRAAGASLVGSTAMHEVALGVTGMNAFGGTRHPLDPARVAGGSSGGAAVSVASGAADFALGSDTGGSVRVPAAFCGVFGFKPTFGTYPLEGALPLSVTCDHAGTLARDAATLARVHAVLTGKEAVPRPWAGLRLGLWNVPGWVEPGAWAALEGWLGAHGLAAGPFDFPDVLDTYTPIVLSEAARVHAAALSLPEPGFTPFTLGLLRRGEALAPAEVDAARGRRDVLRARLADLFARFDLLLAPAVPDVAPLVGQDVLTLPEGETPVRQAILRLTAPWSLLGVPALAVPLPSGGLSVGVQLIAPWGADARLLGLARALEDS